LGAALLLVGRADEAERSFGLAIEEQPGFAEAHSNMLLAMHYRKGDDARVMYEAHLEWARQHARDLPRPAAHAGRALEPARRLNVGYLSPDFRHHAVAWFIESVLAAHDRSRFRTFFYSTVTNPDAVTRRFMKLCDEWRDIHASSDDEAARLIRQDRIDILIDLAGHTGGGRPLLFARKPAPIQVNWLGHPNTTGLAQMDYRITDTYADPEGEADRHHTEKLVRLATGFFCYAPPPDAPDTGEPPVLASGQVTFGCFNNLAKVTPQMIELWARILRELPQARLVMVTHALGEESARRAIHGNFAGEGIAADRVKLFGPESHGGLLGRYREVDVTLDTFPYHGHTTTCEALWMGVPVVTLAGRTHLSRVGVSILRRIGLSELIAATPEEYVRKAVTLARDPERLRELRAGMRQRMRGSPLLDAAAFARALESAYRAMWFR
jgi:predicted O-linked N-acetylglucosamine transferase (SPINDLY family)